MPSNFVYFMIDILLDHKVWCRCYVIFVIYFRFWARLNYFLSSFVFSVFSFCLDVASSRSLSSFLSSSLSPLTINLMLIFPIVGYFSSLPLTFAGLSISSMSVFYFMFSVNTKNECEKFSTTRSEYKRFVNGHIHLLRASCNRCKLMEMLFDVHSFKEKIYIVIYVDVLGLLS